MANYTIKLNTRQARYLRALLEQEINGKGPDTDGYYHVTCDEGDDDVYLGEEDMDNLYLEVERKTEYL